MGVEGRGWKEKRGEKNIDVMPFVCAPTWNQNCNLGMNPDWELKPPSFHV